MTAIDALMTTQERITATVKVAVDDSEYLVDGMADDMVSNALRSFRRWSCDSAKCPGRPASDIALGSLYDQVDPWIAEVVALLRARLTAALSAVVEAHPDIVWREDPDA